MEKKLGIALAAAYATFVIWSYVGIFGDWVAIWLWVEEHETLSVGLLALASAIFGGWLLHRQTLQANDHEVVRRKGRREAIRSVMPLALSTIIRYATDSAEAARVLLDQCVGESLPDNVQNVREAPTIPVAAIDELREFMEYCSRDEIALVSQIPRVIQYQASRLNGTIGDIRHPPAHIHLTTRIEIEEHILDAAEVYARTEALFEWARRESSEMPRGTSWGRVKSAIFLMRLWGQRYERLNATIERRSHGRYEDLLDDR